MKIKKEYIILFLVIAALVSYIALRKENRIQYEIPEVRILESENISGILIQGDGKEINLIKDKDKWFAGQEKFLADTEKVEKMIDFLVKPVLMTVASDSKDYMRYGLDEKNRLIVKALSGNTNERVVEIGHESNVHNHTFIKLEDDYRVYQARENLRDIFKTGIDDIRDKNVLFFNGQETESIHLLKDGEEWAFIRSILPSDKGDSQSTGYQWETGGGKLIDNSEISSVLDDILKIKCSGYIYEPDNRAPGDPVYVIRVKDKNEHILTIFPKKEDDYTGLSSDNPSPFKVYAWRIDNIIEKFDKMLAAGEKEASDS